MHGLPNGQTPRERRKIEDSGEKGTPGEEGHHERRDVMGRESLMKIPHLSHCAPQTHTSDHTVLDNDTQVSTHFISSPVQLDTPLVLFETHC